MPSISSLASKAGTLLFLLRKKNKKTDQRELFRRDRLVA